MNVAMVGSWRPGGEQGFVLEDESSFGDACRRLASAIVRAGHQLIIGSTSPYTADYHAVEGVIQERASVRDGQLMILRPADGKLPFEDLRRLHGNLFTSTYAPADKWEIAKLRQVHLADAVIVIGGASGSYLAGVAAAVAGKCIVPIGSFGGAGKKLISLFQESAGKWGASVPSEAQLGSLHNPWQDFVLTSALNLLGANRKPKILIVHGRSTDRTFLKDFLQNSLGLPEPIILGEQFAAGEPIASKFETLANEVDGAIALVTPDDLGGLADTDVTQLRARQNVWIEVGWFWGSRSLRNVLMLTKGKVEIPSDLAGVETYRYQNSPAEASEAIRKFVERLSAR